MIYGLYHSAGGMMTHEYRQTVIANNLANADTAGFKRDIAVFAERLPAALTGQHDASGAEAFAGLSGGIWQGATHTDFSEGPLERTENPLDVAIIGRGFLTVDVNGQQRLTRDGRMMLDAAGTLRAAADGAAILGAGGAPITVNPRGGRLWVDSAGRVFQNNAPVGQLGIVDVANLDSLRKVGAGRLAFDPSTATAAAVRVESGHVERSAVQPLKELASMIATSRAYQMNAEMVSLQDQSVGRLLAGIEA